MIRVLPAVLLWLLCASTQAVIESHEFDNEELLARYQSLSAELRCPKCQNQNIADSNAPIAADLRAQLQRQLQAGRSDAEIVEFMVRRYGEFVLYRPRWNRVTAFLWLTPLLLLALAAWILRVSLRGGRETSPTVSGQQQAELDKLPGERKSGD